ncbi:hypothetical protein ACOMHN_027555 [Nucella lapillus]
MIIHVLSNFLGSSGYSTVFVDSFFASSFWNRQMTSRICLLLPMFLTSYLNTLVFLLPVQSGEKISFLVSIFVSTSVFISFFEDVMPPGLNRAPATMKLLTGVIIGNFIVLCLTMLVIQKLHQEQAENGHTAAQQSAESAEDVPTSSHSTKVYTAEASQVQRERVYSHQGYLPSANSSICNRLKALSRKVAPFKSKLNSESRQDEDGYRRKWSCRMTQLKCTAQFLDRFFFVITFTSNTVFLLMYLPQLI